MKEHKLVFTGTMGAGKTTAIAAISDLPPISTDVLNTDSAINKLTTTVGFDYGQLTLDSGDRLRLFGTPGQPRFDFMWRILMESALGLIILIDNARPDPLADLGMYLDAFADSLKTMPCVIGVGRTENAPSPSLDDFSQALGARGLVLPVLAVDVRRRGDVIMLVESVLLQQEMNLLEGSP